MAYTHFHSIKQFDFQINRILTYGDKACDINELESASIKITDFNSWYKTFKQLGETAENENRSLHAAYYYRLAEFFLTQSVEKQEMYEKSIENFNKTILIDNGLKIEYVPYMNTSMKTFVFRSENAIGNIVVFGGYDSFIEEFYLPVKELAESGYNIYLFEGPGQGETLKKGLTFEPFWEKPMKAVLDYFNLDNACVIGISWGGYLALRAAAFEKRINKAVAYDVLYDGFDCMTSPFPKLIRIIMRILFLIKAKSLINAILNKAKKKKLIVNWAISHGQYITGEETPYDFYVHLKKHTLKGIMDRIECDVLLLAGEKDHYIPSKHFYILMGGLINAKSVKGKMFTEAEGGAEHCQIGNHRLAIDYILDWL
ncbi:MAG: alpha/beta hydrolase [Oscillospiraceae bacterium]|nr:alpha/beta hydrolase [Oscillospiraceae bacterium]